MKHYNKYSALQNNKVRYNVLTLSLQTLVLIMTNRQPQKQASAIPTATSTTKPTSKLASNIQTLDDLAELVSYSYMESLNCDPDANEAGVDHIEREVLSGHYVPVNPTPIQDPEYITHSKPFFAELGLVDSMAESAEFMRLFSGDTSQVPEPMSKVG